MDKQAMKALARSCAERLTPMRMTVVDEETVQVGDGTLYTRRTDQTPEPYPIVKVDRLGTPEVVGRARPTAPLRRRKA